MYKYLGIYILIYSYSYSYTHTYIYIYVFQRRAPKTASKWPASSHGGRQQKTAPNSTKQQKPQGSLQLSQQILHLSLSHPFHSGKLSSSYFSTLKSVKAESVPQVGHQWAPARATPMVTNVSDPVPGHVIKNKSIKNKAKFLDPANNQRMNIKHIHEYEYMYII